MSKNIVIRLKKAGNRTSVFSIQDNYGNTLVSTITKEKLVKGINLTIEDNVYFLLDQN